MNWRNLLIISLLTPFAAGCHLAKNIAHNVHNEPSAYLDDVHIEKELKKEARAAFAEVKRQYPRRTFGDDFHDGFIDGYTDYLDSGGKADMPAMPPVKYRRHHFLNPEGHARIKDYFLGFKYGMDVAIATGCRPFYTLPILLPEGKEQPTLDIQVIPPPPEVNAPMPTLGVPFTPSTAPLPLKPNADKPKTPPAKESNIPPLNELNLDKLGKPNQPLNPAPATPSTPSIPAPATPDKSAGKTSNNLLLPTIPSIDGASPISLVTGNEVNRQPSLNAEPTGDPFIFTPHQQAIFDLPAPAPFKK